MLQVIIKEEDKAIFARERYEHTRTMYGVQVFTLVYVSEWMDFT